MSSRSPPPSSSSLVGRGNINVHENSVPRASTVGDSTIGGGDGYTLPEYRHGTPWPRPRPTVAVAERERARRRARAERGASTPADAHAELEEKVSACLFGVLPEEYCRDAPPPQTAKNGGGGGGRSLLFATGGGEKGDKAPIRARYEARFWFIHSRYLVVLFICIG